MPHHAFPISIHKSYESKTNQHIITTMMAYNSNWANKSTQAITFTNTPNST